jgi:transposase
MCRFVEGEDRRQSALLPSCLEDYVTEENAARVMDVFVDELDLGGLGFVVTTATTGRPPYHPARSGLRQEETIAQMPKHDLRCDGPNVGFRRPP